MSNRAKRNTALSENQRRELPEYRKDPVALETDWGPLATGGSNFATHNLQQVDSGRWEFTPTRVTYLFIWLPTVFTVLSIPSSYLILTYLIDNQRMLSFIVTSLTGMGLIFGPLISWFMAHKLLRPAVFDRSRRLFWKGRRAPDTPDDATTNNPCCRLDDIYALQILSETVTSHGHSHINGHSNSHVRHRYQSYELNLVLKDGQRLNVVDHAGLSSIQRDAEQLAQLLQVPVWDKTLTTQP